MVFQNSDAKESFLRYKSSTGVLLESWRSKGAMNFRENVADRSKYVFSMFSNAIYALYKATDAVYRCLLFLRGKNGGTVCNRGRFCFFCSQSRYLSSFFVTGFFVTTMHRVAFRSTLISHHFQLFHTLFTIISQLDLGYSKR